MSDLNHKQLIFVGESHTSSAKPISGTKIFAQIGHLKKPTVLLTEFIWPSWQDKINEIMGSPEAVTEKLFERFISTYVAPSSFNAKLFSERVSEFLLWGKGHHFPVNGIDLENFGQNERRDLVPDASPQVLKKVAADFQMNDYMIDTPTFRDIHMAEKILETYNSVSTETLIVIYLGSNHAEKIPTLLRKKIPMDKMLSIHLGNEIGTPSAEKKGEVQRVVAETAFSPKTLYLYPQEDLQQAVRGAQASQTLIYKSGIWDIIN